MFEGGWVREWRALADGPRSERCDVLWLQVGRYFADVRTPKDFHEVAHPSTSPRALAARCPKRAT